MPTAEELKKSLLKNSSSYREAHPELVQKHKSTIPQSNLSVMESKYAGLEDKLEALYPQDKNADGSGVIDYVTQVKKVINLDYEKAIGKYKDKFDDSQVVGFWKTLHKDTYAFADILQKAEIKKGDDGRISIGGLSEEEYEKFDNLGKKFSLNMNNAVNSLTKKYDSKKGKFTDIRPEKNIFYQFDPTTGNLLSKEEYDEKTDNFKRSDRFSSTIDQSVKKDYSAWDYIKYGNAYVMSGPQVADIWWESSAGSITADEKLKGYSNVLEIQNYIVPEMAMISKMAVTSFIKNSTNGLLKDAVDSMFGGSKSDYAKNSGNAHAVTAFLLEEVANAGAGQSNKYTSEKGKKLLKTFYGLTTYKAKQKWMFDNRKALEEMAGSLSSTQSVGMFNAFKLKGFIGKDDYKYYPGENDAEKQKNMEVYLNTLSNWTDNHEQLRGKISKVYETAHRELAPIISDTSGNNAIAADNSFELGSQYKTIAHAFMLDRGSRINTFEEFLNDIPANVYNLEDRHILQFFPEIASIGDKKERKLQLNRVRENVDRYINAGGPVRDFSSLNSYNKNINQAQNIRKKIKSGNESFYNLVDALSGRSVEQGYYGTKNTYNKSTKDLKKVYNYMVSKYQQSFNNLKSDHVFEMTSMIAGFNQHGNYILEVDEVNVNAPDLNKKNFNSNVIMDMVESSLKAKDKRVLIKDGDFDYLDDFTELKSKDVYSNAQKVYNDFFSNSAKDRYKIEYANMTNDPSRKGYIFTNKKGKRITIYADAQLAKGSQEMFASYEYNDAPDFGFDLSGSWNLNSLDSNVIRNPKTNKPMLYDFEVVKQGPYKVLKYIEQNPNVNGGKKTYREMILGESDRMMIKDARAIAAESIRRYNQDYSRVQ